jgi:hypothetical protein
MMMRTLSTAALALATVLLVASPISPARAQSADDLCTPDVMRLCNEFVPDRDKITACLRRKFRAVSKECKTAMRNYGGSHGKSKRQHHRRHKR